MRIKTCVSVALLGIAAAGQFSACMSTKHNCEDYALGPGCETAKGGNTAVAGESGVVGGGGAGTAVAGGGAGTAVAGGGAGVAGGAVISSPTGCGAVCGGMTPICDSISRECVACSSNAHCGGATPACDLVKHQCVGCTSSVSCLTDPKNVCDTSTASCVECIVPADCKAPSKSVCKGETKACVECLVSPDCSGKTAAFGTAGAPGTAGASGFAGAAGAPATSVAVQSRAVCDTSSNVCVGCLENSDCTGSPATPVCNKEKKQCVACLSNTDCTNAGASRCELTTNTCAPCAGDHDCAQIDGKKLCAASWVGQPTRCVECTTANESACNGNSCDPKTQACTATQRGSRKTCQSCLADSECGDGNGTVDANKRCVPMTFKGAKHGEGGYCLQRVAAGCSNPYSITTAATSLSGVASDSYCGINQGATTCEAVLDLAAVKPCSGDGECGAGTGGLCKSISIVSPADRCTIPCALASECLGSLTCSDTPNGYCK